MAGLRREYHHYTDEQVRGHLSAALAILRDNELDPQRNPDILVAIYNSLATKQITLEEVQAGMPGVFPFGGAS